MPTGGGKLTAKAQRAQRRAGYGDGRGGTHREVCEGAKKGGIIATFVVKLTAKARRVRRKQFTLKGVEMFGEKA